MSSETQDQTIGGLGAVVTPPKSKGGFSVPGNVALDKTQTESILANMQRIIDERESPLNLFTSGLKDALAYAAIDPTRNILARDEQKMREQRELFDIRSQMAAVRANQAKQERTAQMYGAPTAGATMGTAGGAVPTYQMMLNSLPPNVRPIAQRAFNDGDFATFEKIVSEHEIKRPDLQKNLAFAETLPPEQRDIFLRTIQEKGYAPQSYIGPDGKEYRFSPQGAIPAEAKPAAGAPAAGAPAAGAPAAGAPLNIRNNNPGNLRDPKTGEFLKFDTMEAGQKALDDDIKLKLSGNSPIVKQRFGADANIMTPAMLAETWAPATAKGNSPESTANYAKFIADRLGIDPTGVIPNTEQARKIVTKAIADFEGGQGTPVATKPAEVTEAKAPAEKPVERKSVGDIEIEKTGRSEFAKGVERQYAEQATALDTAGRSAGDRLNRANKISAIATDKEVKDYLGLLAQRGVVPFTLKQLESGLGIGQFGTINIADLEKNLREANAPKHVIDKLRELDGYIAETKLEYAQVYLKGQGAVSDNERRLVSDAIMSLKDPAARIERQAKVMAERAQFDEKMYNLYNKYRDEKGEYESFGKFLRSKEAADALKQHKNDLANILGISASQIPDDPFKSKPAYQPGSIKWEIKTRNK